ncbi:MAG: hypothetical protein DI561_05220 [Thauera sp.]|nr:MAG: hypothetical protein DI561_05220 [Thauera sp.]
MTHTVVATLVGAWAVAPIEMPLWVRLTVGIAAGCGLLWSMLVLGRRDVVAPAAVAQRAPEPDPLA